MHRICLLGIEFFTNIQLIGFVNHESLEKVFQEAGTLVMIIVVRVAFMVIEKYGYKVYEKYLKRKG
jgi:hypothetical protein